MVKPGLNFIKDSIKIVFVLTKGIKLLIPLVFYKGGRLWHY
jgi:hypothetical protein